ncbi:MAG: hypothetical protein AAGC85_19760 [Bacteroidota bacterium]
MRGPPLKIIFDLANLVPTNSAEEAIEVIRTDILSLFPHTEIVHVKDKSSDGTPTTIGKGILPLQKYIEHWQALDFQGAYIFHGFEKETLYDLKNWLSHHLTPKN